jgi:hypothetical protein
MVVVSDGDDEWWLWSLGVMIIYVSNGDGWCDVVFFVFV